MNLVYDRSWATLGSKYTFPPEHDNFKAQNQIPISELPCRMRRKQERWKHRDVRYLASTDLFHHDCITPFPLSNPSSNSFIPKEHHHYKKSLIEITTQASRSLRTYQTQKKDMHCNKLSSHPISPIYTSNKPNSFLPSPTAQNIKPILHRRFHEAKLAESQNISALCRNL